MSTKRLFVLAAAVTVTAAVSAQEAAIDGSALAIRTVVAGHICRGADVLTFGPSAPGAPGVFERAGQPTATYSVGYGTILVRRGEDLHGHVASVSPADSRLFLGTGTYHCGK